MLVVAIREGVLGFKPEGQVGNQPTPIESGEWPKRLIEEAGSSNISYHGG